MDLCEFEASLVYKATQRNPVSKTKTKNNSNTELGLVAHTQVLESRGRWVSELDARVVYMVSFQASLGYTLKLHLNKTKSMHKKIFHYYKVVRDALSRYYTKISFIKMFNGIDLFYKFY